MPHRDDGVRSVTIGSRRRRVLVLTAACAGAVAVVALAWPDAEPVDGPAATPATTATTVLPVAEPFPALAGQQLLVRSRQDLVVDLGTGVLEPAPTGLTWAPPRARRPAPTVLATSDRHVATSRCDSAGCGIAIDDVDTGETVLWLPSLAGQAPRASFSPDGRHLAYYAGAPGDGVTLWRIVVVDLETGERAEAGPIFHDTFVVLDGGRFVVSPLPEGLVVSDTASGRLTALALHVPVRDVRPYA